MKKIIKVFLWACLVTAMLTLALYFTLPFIYKIKEPYFYMPVEINSHIQAIPIRNDKYGEGAFGAKRRGGRTHKGMDIESDIGEDVYASKSGWARIFYIPNGYGKLVIIDHPKNWQTRYGHLSKISMKKAKWVNQGDIIGQVGKTGNADSPGLIPHLHFEIRHKDTPLDPEELLAENLETDN